MSSPKSSTQPSSPVEFFNKTEFFYDVHEVPTGDSKYVVEIPSSIDSALKVLASPKLIRTQPSSPVGYFNSTEIVNSVADDYSFYAQAKHAEEEGDLEKASSLYKSAMQSEDRVDSAVKDLASVLKRLGRTDEAIIMIKEYQNRCSEQSLDSLDNLLISLYKGDHRTAEHIEFLQKKLESIENGTTFGETNTRVVRVKKKNIVVSIDQQRSRLLGNMAWLYKLQGDFDMAETLFRKALSLVPDKNNQCNLAICLINSGRIPEAKSLLQAVTPSFDERSLPASYIKAFDSACDMLTTLEHDDNIRIGL